MPPPNVFLGIAKELEQESEPIVCSIVANCLLIFYKISAYFLFGLALLARYSCFLFVFLLALPGYRLSVGLTFPFTN